VSERDAGKEGEIERETDRQKRHIDTEAFTVGKTEKMKASERETGKERGNEGRKDTET
jgi:hypothetical protein